MLAVEVPTLCPLCNSAMSVERLRCEGCGSAVEGHFTGDWTRSLNQQQLAFAKVFLSCRGKIKDVEQALGISYPTVVSRLDELVATLTAAGPKLEESARNRHRRTILEKLESGQLNVAEAIHQLRNS